MNSKPQERPRRERARAVDRSVARRMSWARLSRTVLLGTVAVVVAVVWLGEQYGIERRVMLEFVGASFLFVGLLAVAGFVGSLILRVLRNLRKD